MAGELDLTRARILADALVEIAVTDPDGVPRWPTTSECAALLAEGLAYARDHTARRLELYLQRRLRALGCGGGPGAGPGGWPSAVSGSGIGDATADLVARLASPDAERCTR